MKINKFKKKVLLEFSNEKIPYDFKSGELSLYYSFVDMLQFVSIKICKKKELTSIEKSILKEEILEKHFQKLGISQNSPNYSFYKQACNSLIIIQNLNIL